MFKCFMEIAPRFQPWAIEICIEGEMAITILLPRFSFYMLK